MTRQKNSCLNCTSRKKIGRFSDVCSRTCVTETNQDEASCASTTTEIVSDPVISSSSCSGTKRKRRKFRGMMRNTDISVFMQHLNRYIRSVVVQWQNDLGQVNCFSCRWDISFRRSASLATLLQDLRSLETRTKFLPEHSRIKNDSLTIVTYRSLPNRYSVGTMCSASCNASEGLIFAAAISSLDTESSTFRRLLFPVEILENDVPIVTFLLTGTWNTFVYFT